jgi:RNA polymerase sigma factor (sigma-70 family)
MICDQQLAKQSLSGDQESFRQLVERYQAYVFAIIFKFVSQQEEAENIAQEVFLQVYRSLPNFRFQSFKSWIGRIAVTKSIDWKRKNARLAREQPLTEAAEFPVVSSLNSNLPEEIFFRQEDRKRVREICKNLPIIYSRVIIKFYFEGKSYNQIAQEENVSLKTVQSRLYRARIMFKQHWEEGG